MVRRCLGIGLKVYRSFPMKLPRPFYPEHFRFT
jgi:hypothetical protein